MFSSHYREFVGKTLHVISTNMPKHIKLYPCSSLLFQTAVAGVNQRALWCRRISTRVLAARLWRPLAFNPKLFHAWAVNEAAPSCHLVRPAQFEYSVPNYASFMFLPSKTNLYRNFKNCISMQLFRNDIQDAHGAAKHKMWITWLGYQRGKYVLHHLDLITPNLIKFLLLSSLSPLAHWGSDVFHVGSAIWFLYWTLMSIVMFWNSGWGSHLWKLRQNKYILLP